MVGKTKGRTVLLALIVACSCGGGARNLRTADSGVGPSAGTAGDSGAGGAVGHGGRGGSAGSSSGSGGASGAVGGRDGAAGSSGTGGLSGAGGSPSCGDYDQPCCNSRCTNADTTCKWVDLVVDGGVQSQQTCVRSGVVGQPCGFDRSCASGCCVFIGSLNRVDWQCVPLGEACPVGGTCEAGGACTDCGAAGQPCCGSFDGGALPWCAVPATTCQRNATDQTRACVTCGDLGQPCCFAPQAFPVGKCRTPLLCSNGTTCAPPP